MHPSNEARSILAAYPAIDLHADTLMWRRWTGYDLHARHEPPLWRSAFGGHVDLPRMREGGMAAQFFGLVSLPLTKRTRGLARAVDEQIDALEEVISQQPGRLRLVRTADEIEACRRDNVLGALLGIEGAHALEGDLDRVATFARRGVRYLGFLHFSANEAGYPAYGRGRDDDCGLTAWGLELVQCCEAQRVIVDLSHMNRRGFLEACAVATKPVIVSHTGILGAFEHWRNIDDEQLRAVADRGGIVGIIFCPRYIGSGIEAVVKHMRYILDVVGEDVPALGSDWDGFIVPTPQLADPRGVPLLAEALLRAGIAERVIGKILRTNVLRMLAEA
jgi:membrane dipeptidase